MIFLKKAGESSSIRIADDSRNDFSTYHPGIVKEVVDFLKVHIKENNNGLSVIL
jgi:hypothetical protein